MRIPDETRGQLPAKFAVLFPHWTSGSDGC